MFVSQDTVRFQAGPEAKTVYPTYEAVDSPAAEGRGLRDHPGPAGRRRDERRSTAARSRRPHAARAPRSTSPCLWTASTRTATRSSSLGISSSPTKGRIIEVAQNYLTYEAFDDSTGVDVFNYRVRDRLGKEATATVRVGIAPAEEVNQAPYAVKDAVVMRPGREVAVPVMLNDSDPEGDDVSLVKNGLVVPGDRRASGAGLGRPGPRAGAEQRGGDLAAVHDHATRAERRRPPCCRSRSMRTCRSRLRSRATTVCAR